MSKTLFLCEVSVWRLCAGENPGDLLKPDPYMRCIPEDPEVIDPEVGDKLALLEWPRLAEDAVVVSYDFLGNSMASEEFVDLIDAYGDDLSRVLDQCTPEVVQVADSEWLRSKLPRAARPSLFDFGSRVPEVEVVRVRTYARLTCLFELKVNWSTDWESGHEESDGEFSFLGVVPWGSVQAALRHLVPS